MNNDPLRSPKLKIERAKTLIQEVERQISDFTNTVPYNFVIGPHPSDGGLRVANIHVGEDVPVEISLVVGDAIHNLRTALDHIACCLSASNGKTMNGVSFPFAEDRAGYEARAPEKMRKLTPAAKKLINRLKPYGGGNDLLYMLNKLDLRDKHQTLFLHSIYLGGYSGTFSCDHPIQINSEPFGSLDDGVHFATFPAQAKFVQNLQITVGVTFSDIRGIEDQPVPIILHKFVNLVERIVGIFERRFFR